MLYVGLDLSRKRHDFDARRGGGEVFERGAVPPDRDGLSGLVERLGDAEPVLAVIESMSGARFVHDPLELHGWEVRIAEAAKARGWRRLPAKQTRSTASCWPSSPASTWSRRSGCPTRLCAPSGSGPASGCTWSSTAAR